MNKKYLLAVDGGGSKTELFISDLDGNKLYSAVVGSTSHKAIGKDAAFLNLQKGIQELKTNGYAVKDIQYSVWGMSGCDSEVDQIYFENTIQNLGFIKKSFQVCNDAIPSYYAQAQGPGMILIAGTGSIVYGITQKEEVFRLGGWGYGFSDSGAGYWIGNEVLKHALLYVDEQTIWDPIYDLVLKKSGAKSFPELGYKIAEIDNFSVVAQYAPLIFKAKHSKQGERIKQQATKHMAELGAAMFNKLNQKTKMEYHIVLGGGLFGNQEFFQEFIKQFYLLTGITEQNIQRLQESPCVGGIRIARRKLLQD